MRRRRRTLWPRDSSDQPGEQLWSRPLPVSMLTELGDQVASHSSWEQRPAVSTLGLG